MRLIQSPRVIGTADNQQRNRKKRPKTLVDADLTKMIRSANNSPYQPDESFGDKSTELPTILVSGCDDNLSTVF